MNLVGTGVEETEENTYNEWALDKVFVCVFLRLIKKRLPRMAYSVKWAVFRTRKTRVLRLIRLFSRP